MTSDVTDEGVEPIAIVGMAARVPGAADIGEFWRNLVDGVESITTFTREEQVARGASEEDVDDPSWVSKAPYVEGYDQFDAGLFGLSAREAEILNPQHRLFLETCYSALNDAGTDPARYDGAIGVYAGTGGNQYLWENLVRNEKVWATRHGIGLATANSPNYVATTVSYRLDLRGPSFTIHTACSTSLVALHLACEALRGGECDMALAGGVNVEHPPATGYIGVEGFTSPDGHCRPFDADANGTVWGSGVGVAVLKRLEDALADGDHIHAVVRGNAINNDGAGKVGFSAPSVDGQAAAVAQAVGLAGIDPRTIGYVEAHGTGTAMGDPIEVAALSAVYTQATQDRGWCGIGSVKSNIGHLSQAAGIISVIKAVLALKHGLIPPTINYERPNPAIDFEDTPFYVASTLSKWETDGGPRRAGVSSFGIGGTNAHVVLEEAPRTGAAPLPPRPAHLLQVSAKTATALDTAVERLAGHLAANEDLDLADVAHTLRVGRMEYAHRAAVVATDRADAVAALRDRKRRRKGESGATPPAVAFLFSGQGAQHAGMGAELYRTEPVFAAAVDECAGLLTEHLGLDLRDLVFGTAPDADETLRQTRYTQPALFTVEYALARLWQSWGVRPAAMIGHSIGEYVAATVAGVFTLPDAVRLVAARGALMQSMPPGAMLAVQQDESALAGQLPEGVSVATVNGPGTCVVAGPADAIEAFAETLKARKVGCKALRTSHAFHSAMMEPILDEFTALVASVPRQAPSLPFWSNVTGEPITAEQATDPAYWAGHLRQPVRFGACVAGLFAAHGDTPPLLVECGPGRQLAGLARMQLPKGAPAPLPSLPGPGERAGDAVTVYDAAGTLWSAGVPLAAGFGAAASRVPLPAYPFERRRYWIDADPVDQAAVAAPVRRRGPLPLDDWFAVPTWRQAAPDLRRTDLGDCLVLADGPRGEELVAELRARGVTVRVAGPGDHETLLAAGTPARIVHALTLDGVPADGAIAATWEAQERGFFSLLELVQALAGAGVTDGVHLDVVSSGASDAQGALLRPEHATLAGIARVVPLELPGLTVRHIDADPEAGAAQTADLVSELLRPADETEVALRAGRRWVTDYAQVPVGAETSGPAVVRDGGRYLITGGIGGIGITLAEDFARRSRARLALLSRGGLPPREEWDTHLAVHGGADRTGRAILAIRRMEQAGAQVLVLAADVTDPAGLRAVRERIDAEFGGLDGIVHAAGLPGGGMAEVKERAAATAVLAPKIAGTLALAQVFGDLPLDWVALCSSVTSVVGGFGQVDYCAANNFLDAYARSAHGWRAPVVSQNWGGWTEVGMAVEVAAPDGFRAARGGVAEAVDHPVLSSRVTGQDGEAECHGLVSATTHWLLDEHRIGQVPVVPGTGHLETARAAVAACLPAPDADHAVELRDVAFLEPFSVPDGGTAQYRVELTTSADGVEFRVVSRTAGRSATHVRGSAAWVRPEPASGVDAPSIVARCRPSSAVRETGRTSMLSFGPRWDALGEHHVGPDEELARIVAPEAAIADLERWVLHPALLDVATAFGEGRGEGSYLPLSYGRVLVRGPLPARFWSHLRYADGGDDVVSADLTLFDEDGRVLVEIGDFVLRRVNRDAVAGDLAAVPGGTTEGAGAATAPAGDGISPVDGAEAFRRVLAARLGPQVVINPLPVAELAERARSRTTDTIAEDTGADERSGSTEDGDDHATPRNELEATIARVWSDGLGVSRVGIDDDFFELGGNSLIAVQLIASLRKAVGVKLPMRSLFESPTVAELALVVERLRAADGEAEQSRPATTIPKLDRK
ncbi:SDR family NAD(P)-dependent oxidoreductase [Streptosporangium roseum]|uniref:Phenolphthiocerol/phthiocerol polyketide synthase subunit E n=1 Tax=Streptosporangium roseum (strain ATCC 12428 / DSM 43021 / JCM 3005 / KCTC 9067 / NCIMB 10171 / NRRL 2505 / NI 9100) TaxID=479432 RepID=D2B1D6_STRRD|nr:type I polyketide synthase [Streptosporangium roseum]ACZ85401.1 polyketide/non-ribosomal peptide synthetase [Streptosporangium roseum DSM 43021]